MTKYEIQQEISRLQTERGDLITKKEKLHYELSRLNLGVAGGRISNSEFVEYRNKRADICRVVAETEQKIRKIKDKVRSLSLEESIEHEKTISSKTTVEALVALRHEYQVFSADKTRVGSMRQMAAEFALRLDTVIRQALGTS